METPKLIIDGPGAYEFDREEGIKVVRSANVRNEALAKANAGRDDLPDYRSTRLTSINAVMDQHKDAAKTALDNDDGQAMLRCFLREQRISNVGNETETIVEGQAVKSFKVVPTRQDGEQIHGSKEGHPLNGKPLYEIRDLEVYSSDASEGFDKAAAFFGQTEQEGLDEASE